MSGTHEKKQPPTTDQEWARDITERVEAGEHPTSLRFGPYVLAVSDSGAAMLCHVDGGCQKLMDPPSPGQDPDEVRTEQRLPSIHLQRVESFAVNAGAAFAVPFTAVEHSVNWDVGISTAAGASAITVPRTGVYVLGGWVWIAAAGATFFTYVTVNGTGNIPAIDQKVSGTSGEQAGHMNIVMELQAGDTIDLRVQPSNNTTFGTPTGANAGAHFYAYMLPQNG